MQLTDDILSWCPTCKEDKTPEQLIGVPRDDNGNASFFGCRLCHGRTYWHKDSVKVASRLSWAEVEGG